MSEPASQRVWHEVLARRYWLLREELTDQLDAQFGVHPLESEQHYRREQIETVIRQYMATLERFLAAVDHARIPNPPLVFTDVQVEVEYMDTGDRDCFVIVGPAEVNPVEGHVSYFSPMGIALLLKRVGDVIELEAPGGQYALRVIAVRPL